MPGLAFELKGVCAAGHKNRLATRTPGAKAQRGNDRFVWRSCQIKLHQANHALRAHIALLCLHCIRVLRPPACSRPQTSGHSSCLVWCSCKVNSDQACSAYEAHIALRCLHVYCILLPAADQSTVMALSSTAVRK